MILACGALLGLSFLAGGRAGSAVVPKGLAATGGGGSGGHHGAGAATGLGGGGRTAPLKPVFFGTFGVGAKNLWGGGHGQYLPVWAAGRKAGIIPAFRFGGISGDAGLEAEALLASAALPPSSSAPAALPPSASAPALPPSGLA